MGSGVADQLSGRGRGNVLEEVGTWKIRDWRSDG